MKQSEKKAREQVKAVEDRYFRKMAEIECEKGKLERELHSKVEPKYKSVVIGVFIYGFVVTMLKAIKDGMLVEDAVAFGKATISILSIMWRLVDSAARCMMELADKASIEWLPVVVYWIVKICILGMVIGGITVGGILLIRRYVRRIKDNQMEPISVLVSLCIFAIVSYAGRAIKTIITVNLIAIMIVMLLVYFVIRWIVCMENKNIRRDICIWGTAAIFMVGVFACAWIFYGPMVLVLVPVALVMMGLTS